MLREYLALTKPGIIRGNLLVGGAGFLFAANGSIDWLQFFIFMLGTSLIIASGCVFNNVLDREIDARMERTKSRAIVTGKIPINHALNFATILGIIGPLLLLQFINVTTFALGLAGLFLYVVVYGLAKRTTPLSTIIGSLPGAVPPAAGYTAVTGSFDLVALLLFLIMALWQMPHFYAISVYRKSDYANAKLPVWSVKYGVPATQVQIILFIVLYALAVPLLAIYGEVGWVYVALMSAINIWWLAVAARGRRSEDAVRWGKQVFGISLLVILVFSALLAFNWVLP